MSSLMSGGINFKRLNDLSYACALNLLNFSLFSGEGGGGGCFFEDLYFAFSISDFAGFLS